MDTILIISILAAVLCGGLAVACGLLIAARARGSEPGQAATLAVAQKDAQARADERLQTQERALTKLIEERLAQVNRRLTETLDRNTKDQKTALDGLSERLVKIDVAQKNLDKLSTQVVGLQDILANKQARGAFGEVQLQNLVTEVLPAASYALQATLSNGRRVDCLLQLPNPPGPIAIDAKFPLESYRALQAAHQANDEAAFKEAQRRFKIDVEKHIKDIEERYILPGETADAALMFLPSEAVYAELHANFTGIVEKSYRARVFIVSPTTLWATLNTIRAVLRDVHMKEAASVIQTEVMKMLDDVGRLDERVSKLQRHFEQSAEDMRQIRISTDKVTQRGEGIQDLQIEDNGGEDRGEDGASVSNVVAGPGTLRDVSD